MLGNFVGKIKNIIIFEQPFLLLLTAIIKLIKWEIDYVVLFLF